MCDAADRRSLTFLPLGTVICNKPKVNTGEAYHGPVHLSCTNLRCTPLCQRFESASCTIVRSFSIVCRDLLVFRVDGIVVEAIYDVKSPCDYPPRVDVCPDLSRLDERITLHNAVRMFRGFFVVPATVTMSHVYTIYTIDVPTISRYCFLLSD